MTGVITKNGVGESEGDEGDGQHKDDVPPWFTLQI